jgi:hypothetical protein
MNWTPIATLPGGHRLFTRPGSDAVAVADNSGATPDQTEDGILYLDLTAPLLVDEHCSAPVIGGADTRTHVAITFADVLYLSDAYRWTIETRGRWYRSVKTG